MDPHSSNLYYSRVNCICLTRWGKWRRMLLARGNWPRVFYAPGPRQPSWGLWVSVMFQHICSSMVAYQVYWYINSRLTVILKLFHRKSQCGAEAQVVHLRSHRFPVDPSSAAYQGLFKNNWSKKRKRKTLIEGKFTLINSFVLCKQFNEF